MKVIQIHGANQADVSFACDPEIFGIEITWNVSRIERDAQAGRFGLPETIQMEWLPPMTEQMRANIDWKKVDGLLLAHASLAASGRSPLNIPTLHVVFQAPANIYRLPIDGNHRICARQALGMSEFRSYVVPIELEARYRITEETIDG